MTKELKPCELDSIIKDFIKGTKLARKVDDLTSPFMEFVNDDDLIDPLVDYLSRPNSPRVLDRPLTIKMCRDIAITAHNNRSEG
jgi:hypothetical protein